MRFYDLDIDVKNYAKRIMDAGYRCPSDINSVSDFVKGLKVLNLWGNCVFWPLRSNQNAGAGTTAYRLGKLGNSDMSLFGGLTWNGNGITTDGIDDYADANIQTSSEWTFITIMSRINNADVEPKYYWGLIWSGGTGGLDGVTYYLKDGGLGVFQSENGLNNWSPSRPGANSTSNFGFQSVSYSETGPSAEVSLNGSFSTQSSVRNLFSTRADKIHIGRKNIAPGTSYSFATHSFYLYINLRLSNSEVESIRSLYKSTLGKGLNLP